MVTIKAFDGGEFDANIVLPASGYGPGVVVLEDLHWADQHTIDFVRYLLEDLPPALAVVLTYRGEELPDDVRTLGSRLPPAITTIELELQQGRQHSTVAFDELRVDTRDVDVA